MEVAVVIPAYRPGLELVKIVHSLLESPIRSIIVIDDGSEPQYQTLFEQIRSLPGVVLVRHAFNLGKGAALKSGISYVLCHFPNPLGIVTADADGQHHPKDILAVAQHFIGAPHCLVLGSRSFEGHVPWRNKVGNRITRRIVRWIVGLALVDTQTGLRAIPRRLLPKLQRLPSSSYDFELDMLIAAKHDRTEIVEHSIETLYKQGNPSHFNPVVDSLKIYYVLLRFITTSLLTAFKGVTR